MAAFFQACLAWPTALFSLLLVVVILYWLFVIIGALDVDMFDFDADGLFEGAAEGGAEAAAEGAFEGAAEAAGEGAAEGIGDAAGEAAEASTGVLAGLLAALKLRRAPATVVFSFIVLFGWVISLTVVDLLGALAGGVLVATAVGVGAFAVALPLTSLAIRPLGGFFQTHLARGRGSLIGQTCTVSTGKVTATFGQAYCTVGHDELLIQVRCDRETGLSKGDEALIISYDAAREGFVVEPMA